MLCCVPKAFRKQPDAVNVKLTKIFVEDLVRHCEPTHNKLNDIK